MKKTFLLLMMVMLTFGVTLVSCGGDDDEGPKITYLPDTLEVGKTYSGEYTIRGTLEEGGVFEADYPLTGALNVGDYVRISFSIVSASPGFKQAAVQTSFDKFAWPGATWHNDGIPADFAVSTVYQRTITDEEITAGNAEAAADEDPDTGDYVQLIRFHLDNAIDATDGQAVSIRIKDLRIETVVAIPVHFNANGGTGEMVNTTVASGEKLKDSQIPDSFTNGSLALKGWALTTDGEVVNPLANAITAETTFYAIWATERKQTLEIDTSQGQGGIAWNETNVGTVTTALEADQDAKLSFTITGAAAYGGNFGLGKLNFAAHDTDAGVTNEWPWLLVDGLGQDPNSGFSTPSNTVQGQEAITVTFSLKVIAEFALTWIGAGTNTDAPRTINALFIQVFNMGDAAAVSEVAVIYYN
ncbi:MAG: hypothetical protein LBH75_07390 [Treponema sp.]|jgi:hypothetical protein|nr:hypothetical protein [Treponema sp.]